MSEETLYRIISLAVVMVAVCLGWYKFKLLRSGEEAKEEENKKQIWQEAIRYSIAVGVIFMVIVLGIAGHFL